jgi:hypothetical protein
MLRQLDFGVLVILLFLAVYRSEFQYRASGK